MNLRTVAAALALVGALAAGTLSASELRQPTPEVHALTGVRIITAPGEVIERGTVVIRDGVIEAVGANVRPPPDARIHEFEREEDADPVTVYPGLVEPYLVVARKEEGDGEDEPIPPGRHELIHPDRRLSARHWPEDRVKALREAGFTTALIAPGSGLLRGHGLVANLGDGGLSANLLVRDFSQHASFDGRADDGRFPGSLMGAVALMRQTLADARWQQQARAAWQRNPGQSRPEWLEGLDDLGPVLDGQRPLVFESQDPLDSLRILKFMSDHVSGADLVLVGTGSEYQRLDALAQRRVRHIVPLAFPEAPDVKDADDRNVSLEELRHWQNAPDNPRRMAEAGIPTLFTTWQLSQPGDLFARLATSIERGLDPDAALAAVTTAPAEWLGIADRAGRIAPGRMANLVVVEGDLLVESPSISEVWVDGRRYALVALEPPAVDPAGTWALTLGLGEMGDVEATVELSGPPTRMTGTIDVMGNVTPFSEVRVTGERVIARIDATRFGGTGTITIRMDIDGERARGSGSGPFGEFSVRGRRTATPDEEDAS